MENPLNTVTEFLTQEWSKTVEYQTQSWADAKLQLATNQEQIVGLFNKVASLFCSEWILFVGVCQFQPVSADSTISPTVAEYP